VALNVQGSTGEKANEQMIETEGKKGEKDTLWGLFSWERMEQSTSRRGKKREKSFGELHQKGGPL